MNPSTRPLSVLIVACVYLAIGVIGAIYHFTEFLKRPAFQYDSVWIELTELLAVLSGIYMLRRANWARWLALAWMLFHVVLSAFNAVNEFLIHLLFCIAIGWALFRPPATRFFNMDSNS